MKATAAPFSQKKTLCLPVWVAAVIFGKSRLCNLGLDPAPSVFGNRFRSAMYSRFKDLASSSACKEADSVLVRDAAKSVLMAISCKRITHRASQQRKTLFWKVVACRTHSSKQLGICLLTKPLSLVLMSCRTVESSRFFMARSGGRISMWRKEGSTMDFQWHWMLHKGSNFYSIYDIFMPLFRINFQSRIPEKTHSYFAVLFVICFWILITSNQNAK